ncbi:hypothetical protein F5I97DRAFT_1970216 [Phlebopus sp. FC_14]|nr:hypothetical protein F5I97DRAFT_1970216 [Phlebopus sp. FC_14]
MASVNVSETVVRSDEANERQPDWALDPSDPLNLLLNNSNDTDSELSQAATPPDWSQFTSLWPGLSTEAKDGLQSSGENTKVPDLAAGLQFSFPMDLEFNDSSFAVAVDPNSLYLDGKGIQVPIHAAPIQPQDVLAAPFPFTYSSPTLSSPSTTSSLVDEGSRLFSSPRSPGSSSTSTQSAASPVVSAAPKANAEAIAAFFSQARPSVQGLITSFPTHSIATPQVEVDSPPSFPSIFPSPIPSAADVSEAAPARVTEVPSSTVTGRPKTSHTTIERRYRTNLNARIQSLKAAVPALRVLDQNHKNDEYKVNERGYIDGVKVARKGSKANVLGKAVEYIRVLKRREARLKREQDGLRTLICGFPGGQNILSEWDIEWTKKFGGPERDEIDNLSVEEASDEEDGDVEGEDDGDSPERTRKKQKLDSAPPKKKRKIAPAVPAHPVPNAEIVVTAPGVVPEKRKRGRPRKIQPNVPPPVTASESVLLTDPSRPPQQGIAVPPMALQPVQPQQYLLAVFALFSFFNSPLTSSPRHATPHHNHEGSVLSQVGSPLTASFTPASGHLGKDLIQIIHLLASILVIVSIVVPWVPIPRRLSRVRILQVTPFSSLVCASHNHVTAVHEMMDLPTPPASPDVSDSGSETETTSNDDTVCVGSHVRARASDPLIHALGARGSAGEFQSLVNALDVRGGVIGILRCAVGDQTSGQNPLIRHERRAWMRLAELIVLHPEMAPLSLRWQVRNHFSSVTGLQSAQVVPTTPVSDLCTLALLELSLPLPYTEVRSQALWKRANDLAESALVPTFERLVLDVMNVDEASDCLSSSKPGAGSSPIDVLASILLRRRLKAHLSALFVRCVSDSEDEDSKVLSADDSKQWQDTITFGRSLDGPVAVLADAFAKVWRKDDVDIDKVEIGPVDEDIHALLSAVVLYRRIFTPQELLCHARSEDFILSPPPSPDSKAGHNRDGQSKDMVLHLRRALGSSVFEQHDDTQTNEFSVEDARDRVVDMLVNLERGRRSRLV